MQAPYSGLLPCQLSKVHYKVFQNCTGNYKNIFCQNNRQNQIIIRQFERILLSIRGSNILLEKSSYRAFCTQMPSLNSINPTHIYQVSPGACGIYDDQDANSQCISYLLLRKKKNYKILVTENNKHVLFTASMGQKSRKGLIRRWFCSESFTRLQ